MTRTGPISQNIMNSDFGLNIAIASTATVYSHSFSMLYGISFALILTATSSTGTPDLDIYVDQSDVLPTTEGSVDTNYVLPENHSKLIDITDELRHITVYSPVVVRYGRLRIIGQGSNPADCTLAAKLQLIEDV